MTDVASEAPVSRPTVSGAERLTVVDLGVGLGACLAAAHFADLGADVLRVEPEQDPFDEIYPACRPLRSSVRRIGGDALDQALADADVCIVGGESFPGIASRFTAAELHARHPRLVILDLRGGVDEAGREIPAVDLLAQALSGLCFDQFGDRPMAWPLPMPTYAMTLLGLTGVWAALIERSRTGEGQIVEASLQRGAAAITTPDRVEYERPTPATERRVPPGVRQLILPCADGAYIQLAKLPGALATIYRALGIPFEGDPTTLETREVASDPRDFFAEFDLLAEHAGKIVSRTLLEALWAGGIPADVVLAPGECWDDEQVRLNGTIGERLPGVESVVFPLRFVQDAPAPPGEPGAAPEAPAGSSAPLRGIRVVGLGAYIAGPYAARLLADLGASVVKVDALAGDPSAYTYGHWWACNMGKSSIRLNLKTDKGLAVLEKLCARADVVLHNFRPAAARRLKIDSASLRAKGLCPVTLECSAYGSVGPKAEYPGFDQIALGISGNEVRAGGVGNPPLWYRNCVVDYTTGMLGALGVVIALYERMQSGGAVEARINLLDSSLYLMSELIRGPDGRFVGAPLNGPERLGCAPFERLYRTSDGWVAVAARGAAMQRRFCEAIGCTGGVSPPDAEAIAETLRTRTTADLVSACASAEVWACPCLNFSDRGIGADRAAAQAGLVSRLEDPEFGTVTSPGALILLSAAGPQYPGRAPHAGEQSRELLSELGYSAQEIEDHLASGAAS